jgi:hypothetical protein
MKDLDEACRAVLVMLCLFCCTVVVMASFGYEPRG